jgi:hypothetical protein
VNASEYARVFHFVQGCREAGEVAHDTGHAVGPSEYLTRIDQAPTGMASPPPTCSANHRSLRINPPLLFSRIFHVRDSVK